MKISRWIVVGLLLLVSGLLVLKASCVRLIQVQGSDMLPALQPGDLVLAFRWPKDPRIGDLVLVSHPEQPGRLIIRRVLALPGDSFRLIAETPERAGVRASRRTLSSLMWLEDQDRGPRPGDLILEKMGNICYPVLKDPHRRSIDVNSTLLAADAYYVLADNRNHGTDSRTFGPVRRHAIAATMLFRVRAGPSILEPPPTRQNWTTLSASTCP